MASYQISAPDGTKYQVTAPDGATQDQVLAYVQQHHQPAQQPQQPQQTTQPNTVMPAQGVFENNLADSATFGLTKYINPALRAGISHLLPGPNVSFHDALAQQDAYDAANNAAHPLAALGGNVAGAVATTPLLEAATPFKAALALKAAQAVKNTARVAAKGAIAGAEYGGVSGALQGGVNGGNPSVGGALEGAATGGALGIPEGAAGGLAGAGLVGATSAGLRTVLASDSAKSIAALAKTFNVSPAELDHVRGQFKLDTGGVMDPNTRIVSGGRDPSMGELTDLYNRGEVQRMVGKNPILGARVAQAADTSAAGLPARLQGQVQRTLQPPENAAELVSARDTNMNRAMGPIRQDQIPLSPDEVEFMRGEVLPASGLTQQGRRLVHEDLDQGVLSIGSADTLRKSLNDRAAANPGQGFYELANGIRQIATNASPEYQQALEGYSADQRYINGHAHGLTGKTIGQTADPHLIADLNTPEGQLGYRSGLATRYSEAAGKNQSGAASTASDLAQNAGSQANISATFGLPSSQRLQLAAGAESRGLESLNAIAPNTPAPRQQVDLAQVGMGAVAHSLPIKTWHFIKAAASRGMADSVAQKTADYLTDPDMLPKAINLMRAHGISQDQMRQIVQTAGVSSSALTQNQQGQ